MLPQHGLSVCLSDTFVLPPKAVVRNEMPFGRDTLVVPSNCIRRALVPRGKRRFGGQNPPVHNNAMYCQIALSLVFLTGHFVWELCQVMPVPKIKLLGIFVSVLFTGRISHLSSYQQCQSTERCTHIYRVGHKKPSPYMSANYVFQE